MTEQQTEHISTRPFIVKNATIEPVEWDSDKTEIRRIEVLLKQRTETLYIYPRVETMKSRDEDGFGLKKPVETEPTLKEFANEFPKLAQMIQKTPLESNDKEIILKTSGQRTTYEDGNSVIRVYNNMINSEKFDVESREVVKEDQEEKEDEKEVIL